MAAAVVAVIAVSLPDTPRRVSAAATEFVPLASPQRLLDSRPGATTVDGLFAGVGVRPSGSVLELRVAGRAGVPDDAESVALNVTTDAAVEDGFVTVFPCGSAVPNASNLNYAVGQTIANAVITRVGADGEVCLYNFGATNLIADVAGYFPAGAFNPLSQPERLLDTRSGAATVDGEFARIGVRDARGTLALTVAGRAGVPGAAGAVALNVTVDAARDDGFVTVFPCGVALPTASNLNYVRGQTIANAVVARVGANGAVCVYTDGATDLIVDVAGEFPANTLNTLTAPQRLLDTRPGLSTSDGLFAGGEVRPADGTLPLLVAGRAGVPADASAVVLNVTADAAVGDGFVTVHAAGTERPNASNLNYQRGQTIANAAIARVGAGGQICLYTFGATHLIVDVAGWLTGPAPAASDSGCEAASSPPTAAPPTAAPTTTSPVIPPNPGDTGLSTDAAVVPSTVSRGSVASTTAWVTSDAAATVLVALEVYNPAGALVYEQSYDNQSFAAGQRRSYSVDWTVPPTEPLGTHTVRIGVFSPGWGTLLHWNASAAAFTVTAPPPPIGFREEVAFAGLTSPTQLTFSPDGRIFVAEKSGLIKVFDNLTDTTPTVFADLRTNVHNFWDRGLLGMELHPQFPTQPYVYVLYTHDAAIGGTAPRWGSAGATSDGCPTPPGPTGDGCVVSGRLSRLQAAGNVMTGPEQVLIEGWCQQYPSHSVGALDFGADGALYVTGGDGASFTFVDYGQDGNPLNPCGDPPGGAGATLTPPTAQGGALRSQDLRTSGDPASLDGAVLRVDPDTGAGLPDNPLAASADPNARRIIAHGLRNPFRFTIRPGTNEVWIGDVGWDSFEEINRVVDPTDAVVENFGWPCYEANVRQPGYDVLDLNICETLYNQAGSVAPPYFAYDHNSQIVPGETCPTGSSSLAGIAFYSGGAYPAAYNGVLFFADYSRDCIWVVFPGGNGLPNPSAVANFVTPATNPVDIRISPAGELFYVDFDGGTIRRIRYFDGNQPPTAVAGASATNGPAPLTVNFSATGSSDPDAGDTLSFAWDLDGDGAYNDSTSVSPSRTYPSGNVTVGLRVTDSRGASHTDAVVISAGNTPPVATIGSPTALLSWKVGDVIAFSGSATDQEEGALAASRLSWSLIMRHCPSNCHSHVLQTFTGVSSGSFVTPDHEYPSHLEMRLTATESGGLTDTKSVLLQPQTVDLTFQSAPTGLQLVVGPTGQAAPFTRTVIVGSSISVSATSPQTLGGSTYVFSAWSDGGARMHSVTSPATASTYTATFASTGAT